MLREENLTNCNTFTTPIKVGLAIKINKPNNYNKANLKEYQLLIGKPIYLAYGIRLDIAFIVGKLSKHNVDLQKMTFK